MLLLLQKVEGGFSSWSHPYLYPRPRMAGPSPWMHSPSSPQTISGGQGGRQGGGGGGPTVLAEAERKFAVVENERQARCLRENKINLLVSFKTSAMEKTPF